MKGSGKVFSVGGDITEFSSQSAEFAATEYRRNCESFELLANYKKPFVALIDGLTMGGAANYTIPGKYRVVTEKAAFAMPETAIGYFNDAMASYFLSRLDNNLGFYLGMTGTQIKGYDLKKVKLATHVVESSKIIDLEKKLVFCKSHEDVENVLNAFSTAAIVTDLDEIIPKINKCFAGDTVEDIYENLRMDGSSWANKTIKILDRMSPTSLKVTHRSITLGKQLSMHQCLEMEVRLVGHHVLNSDLKEGVRALLIDKDLKPKWSPKTLAEVTDSDVERFFKPLPFENSEKIPIVNAQFRNKL